MPKQILPQQYMEYLGLGAEIAATIGIPILAGYYADKWLDTSPYGVLSGIVVGLFLFILDIFRIANKLNK
ncbi:AtpZ/AtpI family protein [Balneola sp. MJW-20]|uniref:AtpZ/AtpI family protein n=1 Tax=Gracilimonas aurantiaca TaxID=3234185 RepID=UPI0034672716